MIRSKPLSQATLLRKMSLFLKSRTVFALAYGSVLTKRFNKESDVDVAVYLRGNISLTRRFKLQQQLNKLLDRDVDVVVLNGNDLIIVMQALANGKLLVNNRPNFYLRFRAEQLSQYLDFKLSRKVVEENLVRRLKNA